MPDVSPQARPRALVVLLWAIVVVGLMQTLGATFEALNMIVPSLLPSLQANEVMQLHHDQPLVEAWTTGGNLAGMVLGVGFIVGGVRLLRGDARGLGLTRACALATLIYAVIGAVVSGVFLVPMFIAQLDAPDPEQQQLALVFLISLVGASGFFIMFSTLVFVVFGRPKVRDSFKASV
ncbi:hypothetical protein [Enhygromyxa salina]|uniref:DUF2975 domain-containing protein n=1 Tax=Enhygromyxa salina TaxID=215803 RepID=A0A2S9YT84_9BACT|nr:hypothetical protein [Enhygromyxa salina]PRQ08303.1 hypothetical protein ENSA7_19260 [Enhygromyxa salina]